MIPLRHTNSINYQIALMKRLLFLSLFLFPLSLVAQISGIVRDETGAPLPYATVYIRNTTNGTVTNGKGMYKLTVGPGTYEVVFQYIGYKQRIENAKVGSQPTQLNVRMEPNNLEIGEVVITGEDPAYKIMREAIAKRNYYKNKISGYTCDAYVKGMYKIKDAPKKIMGRDIGNMGGMLDTSRSGIIYLSESVSKVYSQVDPPRTKEVMISSKVSGSDDGFSVNRANLVNFSLYYERIDIGRDILSPLADNAFSYYRFKYKGEFKDENGYTVNKIEVIPKQAFDPTYSGFIYIVDNYWNLAGVDLYLTGKSIQQPILDTLHFRQEFIPLEKPDTWKIFSQLTAFKFGILGFKFDGYFNTVLSNYDLKPIFPSGFFGKETFKVDNGANERDTAYWANIRPIPLTKDEVKDYSKKDSLQRIWKSEVYLDSTDRKHNKFGVMDILGGYSWRNSYTRTNVSVPGIAQWLQFNSVQGWLFNIKPEYSHSKDKYKSQYIKFTGNLNYGFSEKKLRGGLDVEHRFDRIRYSTITVSGGVTTAQFNDQKPISELFNELYSLLDKRNFMRLYDKTFATVRWSERVVPDLQLAAAAEWASRSALTNHSNFSWYRKDRTYASNDPVPGIPDQPFFNTNQTFTLTLELKYRPGTTYSSYPGFRNYESSDWPEFNLLYRKAIPGVAGSDMDYDFIQLGIVKDELRWGLFGYSEINLRGGMFLRKKTTSFMDLYHPNGNQTWFAQTDNYTKGFMQLPYYAFSTGEPFVEGHFQHCLQGWLLDKLPLLRRLQWKEVLGASVLYSKSTTLDPTYAQSLPYWEFNAGFKNIGFKSVRPLRVDVVTGYFGSHFYRTGIVVGLTL
jgi:hypothetical protein